MKRREPKATTYELPDAPPLSGRERRALIASQKAIDRMIDRLNRDGVGLYDMVSFRLEITASCALQQLSESLKEHIKVQLGQ